MLPDQPDDWTEPGAFPVAPGVHRIPLPMPDTELHAVNVYAVSGGDGITLVDSGWSVPAAAQALVHGLTTLGHRTADVVRVITTHAHHDHYTHGLALRAEHGTRVLLGRNERFTVEAYERRFDEVPVQVGMLEACGAPELGRAFAEFAEAETAADDGPWGLPDAWLDDGDVVDVGTRALQVRATPGHTRGHLVVRDPVAGALYSGDHVLPHITPSIAYERVPAPMPLRDYLSSLRLVRDLPDTLLFPAHGPVTASAHVRVEELMAHHDQRLTACAAAVAGGAATAFEVAQTLPWTRKNRRLDELASMHAVLAVLETDAHLEVLADQGHLTTTVLAGVTHYA